MFSEDSKSRCIEGPRGKLEMLAGDEAGTKLAMLYEGTCMGLGAAEAARKYGYSKQRFYQLRAMLKMEGVAALQSRKRGPKGHSRRTDAVEREVIRLRFLDPEASPEVMAQKLRQTGHSISVRSVERVVQEYGLQKKTPSVRAEHARAGGGIDATDPDQTTR